MRRLIKRVLLSNLVSFSQTLFNSFKTRVIGNSGVVEAESCAVTTLSNLDARNLLQSATFVLAPSGYKSGVIYSQVPSNGNGDLTVTRATSATRVNSSGIIETVASGVPQLDYSLGGCPNFLFEPQRRNLWIRSEEFDNATWTLLGFSAFGSGSIANYGVSPDGNQTADLLSDGSGSGVKSLIQGVSTTSGNTFTISVYAKTVTGGRYFRISNNNGNDFTVWAAAQFDLQNGTYTTGVGSGGGTVVSASVTSVGNGWYRCVLVCSINASSLAIISSSDGAAISPSDSRGRRSYTGSNNTYLFWGAQFEDNGSGGSVNYPTSYIPTTSAAVTRNATSFTRSNIYTNGLIGASGGTWFVEFKNNLSLTRDSANSGFGIKSNSDNNGIYFRNTGTTRLYLSTCINGVNILGQYQTTDTNCKMIITWNGTLLNAWQNGLQVITNLSFTITNMELINGDFSLVPIYISKMALWNTALPDAQCIALTS